jgi:hypothetical protein
MFRTVFLALNQYSMASTLSQLKSLTFLSFSKKTVPPESGTA